MKVTEGRADCSRWLPIGEQQNIIKDGVDFWRGLQQAYHGGKAHDMGGVGQELGHTVGSGAVQAGADLVHQQHTLQPCTHSVHMTCAFTHPERRALQEWNTLCCSFGLVREQ